MNAPNQICSECPAFLRAEQTPSKFKKSVGAPMCGRFGHVLGKPGLAASQQDKLQRHFASTCGAFGQPLPPVPVEKKLLVALPDPKLRVDMRGTNEHNTSNSCSTCKNCIREDVVANELGWTASMCAAKGKLLLGGTLAAEAKECEYRAFGPVLASTSGIHLLPEYDDAFNLSVDPVRSYFKNKDNFTDPRDYVSDKPVTEDEHNAGIRAWREVKDPAGTGRVAYLPIYRHDGFFSPEEQAKVPQAGDDEHPELYVDHFGGTYLAAVAWTELDETPALWGEAGVGKTELYRYLAWLMQLPFERISITASTEIDELIGKMLYNPERGTYFEYGRLPLAWGKPCVLVIDEPNLGPLEVWQRIRPLTDNSKQMVIDENQREHLDRHDDCYFGVAMNPAWDARNIGANQIADADANRLFHVYVDLPPTSLEREIIRNRVAVDGWEITDAQLDMLINIAQDLRDLSKDGTLTMTWGIRPQIKVARALAWFDTVTAYRRAVGDFLEPRQQEALLDMVKAHA